MKPSQTSQASQERINEQLSKIQELLEGQEYSTPPNRTNVDHRSSFWASYERIAQKDDDDFLERYNGTLDVLLIFAGLFAGVSSSFISNIESRLQPNPTSTTNALLQLLVQAAYNQTSDVTSIIPSTPGPSSIVVWTQGLAYASLSLSLLTAFTAVLGKQWLGHYKNARFGHGSQDERCTRRQLKLLAMNKSYLYFILDSLPFLLQLSLLLFGISIAGTIYVDQRALGSIIVGMVSSGIIFYSSMGLAGFLSKNSPYQTGITSGLRGYFSSFFTDIAQNSTTFLKSQYRWLQREVYPAGHSDISSSSLDTEEKGHREDNQYGQNFTKILEPLSNIKMTNEESNGHLAVRWVLETSTDPEVIAIAINMIPEVVWPADVDRDPILGRLREYYDECDRQIYALPLSMAAKARACDRAIMHLLWTGDPTQPDFGKDVLSIDVSLMIWLTPDSNFKGFPEYVCARLHRDEKFHKKNHPINDPEWLSYMIPYIILLRGKDQVVIANSVPIWYNILNAKGISTTSKVNALAGVACALNIPSIINLLALHNKSGMQNPMLIEVMEQFRKSIRFESITRLADIPITWYLLEPFSMVLNSLSSTAVRFDRRPDLKDSAYWALKIFFKVILLGKSEDQVKPVLNVRRIYEGALRLCGHIIRQSGSPSAIEEFHDTVSDMISNLTLPPDPDYDIPKKLFIILAEMGSESDLDLAADALLVLGTIGAPLRIPGYLLERCVATLNACLRGSGYHRSTALYAIWAARRRVQASRVVDLTWRLFSSIINITPNLRNLTDLNLSVMLSRIAIKDIKRDFSASERNALSKLSIGIRDLRPGFQNSSEERFVNLARLPIQFIDLYMLVEGRRPGVKASIRKNLTIPLEVLADIAICGWKWFEPHGSELLFGHGYQFWNLKTESIIMTWVYTQLYFDFPAIISSFILWTSNTLESLIAGSREIPESVQNIFSHDVVDTIQVVIVNLIRSTPAHTRQYGLDHDRHMTNRDSDSIPTIPTILDCVTEAFEKEDLAALASLRQKDLENLLVVARNLEKIVTEFRNKIKVSRKSRDSSERPSSM